MKRIFLVFLVLAIAISAASAQPAKDAPPAGTTRVAVVNIGYVFSKYDEATLYKQEIENTVAGPKKEALELIDQMKKWGEAKNLPGIDPADREDYEGKIRDAKRRLEEMGVKAQELIKKRQEENLVVWWKAVREGIRDYATQNGIQLVLAYGDPKEKEMLDLFPNVNRKMQAMDQGSMVPLFVGPGVDISEAVTDLLIKRYRESKTKQRKETAVEMK